VRYDFDQLQNRCGTDSMKWCHYPEEAIPLWVADLDFRSPEPVIRALRQRVEHGVFGYGVEPPELRELFVDHLQTAYGWTVSPDSLLFLGGVVAGFNLVCQAQATKGDAVLVQTPAYPPILEAPDNAMCTREEAELGRIDGAGYRVDIEAFEDAIGPRTRVFILCNPHNPTGRVFSVDELVQMAEVCLRHGVVICSDEIHCDFVYPGHRHVPIAALSPEVEQATVTLMAPSKTYNIAGLHVAVAVVPNPRIRARMETAMRGICGHPDILSFVAAVAAYRDGQEWLEQLLQYLGRNRDLVDDFVRQRLEGVTMVLPEGTYLAWLDVREAGIEGNPQRFFLELAKVALNDGPDYGQGGKGYLRLNFGCPRATLELALERMARALDSVHGVRG
jgi:cystathionine beta-lyase